MAIKCGNCGREFESVKKLWEHMIDDHNSPAFDGEARQICEKILKDRVAKNNNDDRAKAHLSKLEDY